MRIADTTDDRADSLRRVALRGGWLLLAPLWLASCARDGDDQAFTRVDAMALPVAAESAQPDLLVSPSGEWLLSWVEPVDEKNHRLCLSRLPVSADGAEWSAPVTIAQGADWFLNWADTPHVYALQDGSLWAHWLRSTGPSRMDYGIELTRSGDGGASWSAPRRVQLAASPGDHGFVSFWPQSADRLGLAWLDSRQKAAAHTAGDAQPAQGHDHGGGAPMMLRAAVYGPQVENNGEWPLDTSTCDCCTTASAVTERGAVVVYRGRGEGEIRDIRLVSFDGQGWTPPRDVHRDGWRNAGCPVNGPTVTADGNTLWVAWYTEADGTPELRAAYSNDAGDAFSPPITVASGPQVLGRAGIAQADGYVLVAWLEQITQAQQRVMLTRYDALLANPRRIEAGRLSARGGASGMPRLAAGPGVARLVWTDVVDGHPVVRGVRLH